MLKGTIVIKYNGKATIYTTIKDFFNKKYLKIFGNSNFDPLPPT